MEDERDKEARSGLDRRKFLGALGATAAAGMFLESGGGRAEGASPSPTPPSVLYQDSFGNIGPASPSALAAGIVPPPIPSGAPVAGSEGASPDTSYPTYVTQDYTQPNFLMIMVDQLGTPRWLPTPTLPNINSLIISKACAFPNYFVAATACTPSRATLLTGLYSQQTYIFGTLENWCEPQLLPYNASTPTGFPTIGNVLSQQLPIEGGGTSPGYDTVWIGKWHVSATGNAPAKGSCSPGGVTPGPAAYGFNDPYCIPNITPEQYYTSGGPALAYPSPDGTAANEGVGGALLTPYTGDTDTNLYGTTYVYEDYPTTLPAPLTQPLVTDPGYLALGDGAIAHAFTTWLEYAQASITKPWFCAVSLINPHDMSAFPYGYGLAGVQSATLGDFGSGPTAGVPGYVTPVTTGFDVPPAPPYGADEEVVAMTTTYQPGGTAPVGPFHPAYAGQTWNNPDNPSLLPYGPTSGVYGKPSLQWAYQSNSGKELGTVENQNAWFTFLNYYFWMQANVDVQVGRVMNALNASTFASNTIVVFLSDHGDYAGSHSLHGKAFALYDETINVPLYIKFPTQKSALPLPYACSSVDILPFLYTMAIGNASWRSNSADLVGYLYNREAISDFILSKTFPVAQHRVSTIPAAKAGFPDQPYILHTTDEGFTTHTLPSGQAVPGHAIAFRTVDYSEEPPPPAAPNQPYGGGKLGMYNYWNDTPGGAIPPTQPDPSACPAGGQPAPQYEFYEYSSPSLNYGETGNQVTISGGVPSGTAGQYLTDFNNIAPAELYGLSMPNGAPLPTYITNAQSTALNTYLTYWSSAQGTASTETTWQK